MSFMEKMSSLAQRVVVRITEFIVYFSCGIQNPGLWNAESCLGNPQTRQSLNNRHINDV